MKALFAVCLMLMMTACAAVDVSVGSARVPVQFATLKAIEESSSFTARDVLNHTARVRQIVATDAELNITALLQSTIEQIGLERFDASDRLLLMILFNNIEQAVVDVRPDMPLNERQVRLITLLDWIDDAARLYL